MGDHSPKVPSCCSLTGGRAQEGRSHLSPTLAHTNRPQPGQSCLQAVAPPLRGLGPVLLASSQPLSAPCSGAQRMVCVRPWEHHPHQGWPCSQQPPQNPISLPTASWGQHGSAARTFSLTQAVQLAWGEGWCCERLSHHCSPTLLPCRCQLGCNVLLTGAAALAVPGHLAGGPVGHAPGPSPWLGHM